MLILRFILILRALDGRTHAYILMLLLRFILILLSLGGRTYAYILMLILIRILIDSYTDLVSGTFSQAHLGDSDIYIIILLIYLYRQNTLIFFIHSIRPLNSPSITYTLPYMQSTVCYYHGDVNNL